MNFKQILIFVIAMSMLSCVQQEESVTNDTLSVIHSRKSVRTFTEQSVGRDTLMTIVKAGMAAPSAMDRRPWEFVIVEDRATLNEMAESLPYAKMLKDSPAAIVVCGNTLNDKGGSSYWYFDCSAATQNILLATEAMGLGATWTAVYPSEERMQVVKKALSLPDHISALCVIPIGYPKGEQTPKEKFNPAKVHFDKW